MYISSFFVHLGYCLEAMSVENGVDSKDKTSGSLVSAGDTKLLTFSEAPNNQADGNTAILEREFTREINVHGVYIALTETTSSVTSGQGEGRTTPQSGSTSPQSVKISFTLHTRKAGETEFREVPIGNARNEVSKEQYVSRNGHTFFTAAFGTLI